MTKIDRLTKREAQAVVELTKIKSSGLETFRSQPHQDEIFTCTHRELLVQGGNRSGKSLTCAVKFAALAMNKEITLSDGTKYNPRQPHQRNRPLTMWTIAYSNTYIGQTIYRLLFQPNLFDTLLDKETRRYRAFDWTNPADVARRSEVKPSRPLIPRSYVKPKSWSWLNRGNKEFERVTICNPQNPDEILAEIFAYGSMSDPKAGDPVDVIWLDEAIEYPQHYSEWQARLVDRRGNLFWSSWPRGMNQALVKLEQRAIEDLKKDKPLVKQVILTTTDNMQIDPEGKEQFLAGLTEEEKITRDKGRFNFDRFRMYETFEADKFLAIASKVEDDDEVSKILRATGGEPPDDWCRELILDPGTAHPAILLCAIPPPTLGEFYVAYDEIYPGRADAVQLAALAKQKLGNFSLHRMMIDKKAGKQTPMSFSISISENYEREFEKVGIKCEFSGSTFTWGLPEIGPRILKLKSWMHINPRSGRFPYLRIVKSRCPNLIKQLTEYAREDSDDKEFRPAPNQKIDVAQCYDEETEVLTKDGWKFFRDCVDSDLLATVNLSSLELEYQKPTRYTKRFYEGEMVRIKSRRLDLCVTPEHRMVVRKQHGGIAVVLAKDLKKTDRILLCPKKWKGVRPELRLEKQEKGHNQIDKIEDVVAFAEFMGWFISEGCAIKYRKKGRGYQVVISQRKEHRRLEIEECLRRNPFHYTKDGINYLISHKQLWHYCRQFGKAHEKFVPQWIKDADQEVIRAFLKGYMAGDGHYRNGVYVSSSASQRLSDDIQELILKCGEAACRDDLEKKDSVIRGNLVITKHNFHQVRWVSKITEALLYRRDDRNKKCLSIVKKENYSGFVYCASVPNTTLVVRRKGRVAVSGNCLEYFAASSPKWVPPKRNNRGLLGSVYKSFLFMTGGNQQTQESSYSLGSSYSQYQVK